MVMKDHKLRQVVSDHLIIKARKPFILAASEGHVGGGIPCNVEQERPFSFDVICDFKNHSEVFFFGAVSSPELTNHPLTEYHDEKFIATPEHPSGCFAAPKFNHFAKRRSSMKKLLTGILSTLALAVLMAVPAFAGTLVFDTAGGTFIAPSATYTKPEDPVRAGHTFTGWVDDDGKAITFNGSDVSGSKTAHATWKVSTYQIRFPSKVKLTGSDLTYGSTINTYTNTEGLSPLAKVSANAVISEFVNDRDPSVRISANQQQTNTVPEIGQQTGEKHYQQNISQQFTYPGNYTASATYHVEYKEKVNVSITCSQYPTAIESVTGDMTAWPGEEIHLQVAYAIGYDNSSYTKSSVENWSAHGNGKDFRHGLVDEISFKVPENATGTIEIEATVIAHIFRYTVRHYQEKIAPAGEYDLFEITNHEGFAGSYVGIEDYGNTYEGFTIRDEGQTLLDGDNKIVACHYTRNSYDITLNGNSGTPATQTVSRKFGEAFGTPSASRTGYDFAGWFTEATDGTKFESTATMPSNALTLYAHWTPKTDTRYTVEHYQQNLDGNGYTLVDTDNLTGTTDTSVTPARKSYTGFMAPESQEITILGNGSAKAKYYYARNQYTITTQIRLENADGTFGDYTTVETVTKRYGETYSYTRAADATHQAATTSFTVTGPKTNQLNVMRKTFTVSLAKGTGIHTVTGAGTYRVGQTATCTATCAAHCLPNGWTGTSSQTGASFTTTTGGSWTANAFYAGIFASNITAFITANKNTTQTIGFQGDGGGKFYVKAVRSFINNIDPEINTSGTLIYDVGGVSYVTEDNHGYAKHLANIMNYILYNTKGTAYGTSTPQYTDTYTPSSQTQIDSISKGFYRADGERDYFCCGGQGYTGLYSDSYVYSNHDCAVWW